MRRIRSFVLRTGRITTGQKRAMEELWPRFGIDTSDTCIDLAEAFGSTAPVTLEIGFGNGDNLVDMAAQAPDQNFLGIEVHDPGVGRCLLGVEQQQLQNVRVICRDALEVLECCIADASLQRANLFFPDPWHKKRHHKRRIVQHDFVRLIGNKLQADGIFHIATDWPDYAEHIAAIMVEHPEFAPLAAPPKDRSISRFDRRGQGLGHTNWEQAWCKRSKIPN